MIPSSAVALRALITRRALSPVEIVRASLDRVASSPLNAFTHVFAEAALAEARAAEARVMSGEAPGLLAGLPVAVKEPFDVTGVTTTRGWPPLRDAPPAARDAPVVAALRRAGGALLGKTNLPDLEHGMTSRNPLYGATLNPFDASRSCGGSSGGAAVAVAAGLVPLSAASDTGGSIRGPAAVNGVFGMRPTPGIVPRAGRHEGFSGRSVYGPMAGDVPDLALLLAAMVHRQPDDPFDRRADPASFHPVVSLDPAPLRIAVSAGLGHVALSPGVADTFRAKAACLLSGLPRVEEASPDLGAVTRAFWLLRPQKFMAEFAERYAADPAAFSPYKRLDLRRGYATPAADIAWAEAERGRAFRAMAHFFKGFDVLVTPAAHAPPATIAAIDTAEARMRAANDAAGPYEFDFAGWDPPATMNTAVTLTGNPVVTMPAGRGPDGLPFGLNLIGAYGEDARLLGIAAALAEIAATHPDLARPMPG